MLISSLEGVRRRVRALSVLYGLGILVAAAVALLLVVVGLDYLLNLPAGPRVATIIIAIGALLYVGFRWVFSPLLARLNIRDVAGRLESAFPQFNDRLRSTVDFVSGKVPGSEYMQQKVVAETTSLASSLNLNHAIVARPVWYSLSGAMGALVLLLGIIALLSPQIRQIALSRLISPFHAQSWPKSVKIDLLSNVPQRVPVGQHIDVRMKLAKGDRTSAKAIVYTQYGHLKQGQFVADGQPEQEYMQRAADGTFASSLDARVEADQPAGVMRIMIKSGDDEVRMQDITIVPRLMIKSATATITPPEYVSGAVPPTTFDLAKGPALMPVGATVQLDVKFNKPLAGAPSEVRIDPIDAAAHGPQIASSVALADGVSHRWLARESMRFHIRASDTDGFSNLGLEEYELIVRPDQNPSVQIENPRRNEERTATSVIPLQALAEDDYGIKALSLVIDRVSGSKQHWEIPLVENSSPVPGINWSRGQGGDRLRYKLGYAWDLAKLDKANLKPGDVLEYFLVVRDNFSLASQTHPPVASGHLRVSIISQEDLTSRVVDELRNVKQQIGQTKAAHDRTHQETASLAEDTKAKPRFDDADRTAAERLANQQATSATQSKQLVGKLEQIQSRLEENRSPAQDLKDITRDVKNDLNDAAENPMKDATQQLGVASQPQAPPDTRNPALANAQSSQQKASDDLKRAMDRMEGIGTLAQTIDAFSKLLEEQQKIGKETADVGRENLGKKPEELKPEDRDRLNKAADDQAKLAEKTNAALANMNKMAEQLKQADPSGSEAMKQASATAQQQQVTPNQQKAAAQTRQNQQGTAQAAQKQAELGLQMILSQLKEAERRKLAELSKQLNELQKQVANLVRRQAGHNLDNLSLLGRLAKIDSKLRTELFAKAERDEQKPAPADANLLNTGQELTERNTRDIAKGAETLPNGAGTVAQLVRAAGKMERAIVYLRQKKPAEAYEPPQVEALAALEEAKKLVDQMKQKVDEKIAAEQREAIRQQYVKLRDDQQKLNDDTIRVDKSRAPDGSFPRQEGLRLRQLPADQGKLADRVHGMEEALEAVGSTVYLWANHDIIKSMNEVKADLAKPQTDAATQTEQHRIVAQLTAMIDNLTEHPIESKFAQNGGGGSGQSRSRLPSESELRLMKALQQAVNDATKQLAAMQKDPPKLLALGNRQGELRTLLGQLLEKASNGEIKFGPEPDKRDQLPEEAGNEAVENQELDQALLNGQPDAEQETKQINRVGDRMGRVRQRLALDNDPGKTTQTIEDRILGDLDVLIEQSRRKMAQARNQKPSEAPPQQGQPQPNGQQANNQGQQQTGGTTPAGTDASTGGNGQVNADLSKDIRESQQEWGGLTPRQRAAVLEGGGDSIVPDYAKLIDEYFKTLSKKGSER
jgi:hypothetical protein